MNLPKSFYVYIGIGAAVILAMVPLGAGAIDKRAPDSGEYGLAGTAIRLALSNRVNTGPMTEVKVPIYIKAPADADIGTLRANIELYDFIPYRSTTYGTYGVWLNDQSVNGNNGGVGRCYANGSGQPLEAGNFEWMPKYGLWRTTVYTILRNKNDNCNARASRASNAQIDFRMRIVSFTYQRNGVEQTVSGGAVNGGEIANGGNAWISYAVPDATSSNDDSYYFSTTARARGSGFADYSLAMATPCDAVGPLDGVIELFDLDSRHEDNGRGRVEIYVTQVGSNVRIPLTPANSGDGPFGDGDGERYMRSMTFQPGARYTLHVDHINYINVLQYRLPFENIGYVTGCPRGELSPRLTTSLGSVTSVREGTDFTANFGIYSTSPSSADAHTFARIWYESDGNSVFNTGVDSPVWTRERDDPNWDRIMIEGDNWVHNEPVTVEGGRGTRICASWNLISTPTAGVDIKEPRLLTQCFTILRSPPYVQIWGNDLRTGSSFGATNLNSSAGGSLSAAGGSWVEYAITTPNSVNLLASQSGAINGSSADQSQWSRLTFANNGSTCQYGCFAGPSELGRIPDIRNALTGVSITHQRTGPVSTADIASIAGNLNDVAGSNVIVTNGTITIDQDITYHSTGLSNSQSIPQLILVGRNINIAPNVTHVDAWLIVDDTINTCSGIAQADLRSTNCQLPLRINGPVMASQLLLHRTYSNTADPSAAAEVINLRGDAYVWANRITKQNGSWQTTYTTELPPRY